jgi:hypothetical protein
MNDVVFNKIKSNTYLQIIFKMTYWIRQWSLLHKKEERLLFKHGCKDLETMIMVVFVKFGWCFLKGPNMARGGVNSLFENSTKH